MLPGEGVTAGAGAAAALFGFAAKVLIDRFRHSGTVETSTSAELWDESSEIRKFLREQVGELESKVNSLEKRVDSLTDANDGLRFQLQQATDLVRLLKAEREQLTAELHRARAWADELVAELQRHDIALPEPPRRRTP